MGKSSLFHLFRTINKCYLYDTGRNDLLPVSEEDYQILGQLHENKISYDEAVESSAGIRNLVDRGYLSTGRVQKIEHPLVSEVEISQSRRIEKITLQLTQNCNFRCTYCSYTNNSGSQRTHSNKRMSLETGKKAILFLRDHSADTKELYVGFYGGEPLLEFDTLRDLLFFAEEALKGKHVIFTITTNSTLLTDEMLQFFEDHDVAILISIDGPQKINDKNRVFVGGGGTFDKIIERLGYIQNGYKKLFKKLSINIVMNPSDNFDEITTLITDYPFLKEIQVMSTLIDDTDAVIKNVFSEDFLQYSNYHQFLCYLSVLRRYPFEKLTHLYRSFEGTILDCRKISPRVGYPVIDAPGGPCMPGEARLLVNVDGDLIICERISETSPGAILGNLSDGFDNQKAKALLNISQITEDSCKNCWAFSGCLQCAKTAIRNGQFSAEARLNACDKLKTDFEFKLRQLAFLRESHEIYGQVDLL